MNPVMYSSFRLLGGLTASLLMLGPIAASFGAAEVANSSPNLAQRQPLIVGAFSDAYPYSYMERNGGFKGSQSASLDAVAKAENLRFERVVGTGDR